jgi:hypothetical protein
LERLLPGGRAMPAILADQRLRQAAIRWIRHALFRIANHALCL